MCKAASHKYKDTKRTEAKLAAAYAIGDSDVLIVVDAQMIFVRTERSPYRAAMRSCRSSTGLVRSSATSSSRRTGIRPDICHSHRRIRNTRLMDTIAMPYGPQVLWPYHRVQGTPGASFHSGLQIPLGRGSWSAKVSIRRSISYSALYENDRTTPTGLTGYLRERGIKRLFLAGLALDFCVRYSAEDAVREGFAVVVIEDARRGIDVQGSVATTCASFAALGVPCIKAGELAATAG